MREIKHAHKVGKSEGPRYGIKDNIKMDFKQMQFENLDWISIRHL
jgi:hypothetical protein